MLPVVFFVGDFSTVGFLIQQKMIISRFFAVSGNAVISSKSKVKWAKGMPGPSSRTKDSSSFLAKDRKIAHVFKNGIRRDQIERGVLERSGFNGAVPKQGLRSEVFPDSGRNGFPGLSSLEDIRNSQFSDPPPQPELCIFSHHGTSRDENAPNDIATGLLEQGG